MSDTIGRIMFVNDEYILVSYPSTEGLKETHFRVKKCKDFTPEVGTNIIFDCNHHDYFDDFTFVYFAKDFPRYFAGKSIEKSGFAYIEVTDINNNFIVEKDGSKTGKNTNSLTTCMYCVSIGSWKEITKEEALARVDVKFPKYYKGVNDKAYFWVDNKTDFGTWVQRDGQKTISSTYNYANVKINDSGFTEITEKEAFSRLDVKFPRYFITTKAFFNDIVFIQANNEDNVISVRADGTYRNCNYSYQGCMDLLSHSDIKEVIKEEAEKLIVLSKPFPRYFFPRYFIEGNTKWFTAAYVVCTDKIHNYVIQKDGSRLTYNDNINNFDHCMAMVKDGSWKEATKEEAESKVTPKIKFPRYFIHNIVSNFDGTIAYVRADSENVIVEVRIDGSSKESEWFKYLDCERYVKEYKWKEVTEEEAKREVKTRYFTDITGFAGNYAYVVVGNGKTIDVKKNGETYVSGYSNIAGCELYVKNGFWKEITKEETEKLIHPKITITLELTEDEIKYIKQYGEENFSLWAKLVKAVNG